MNPEARRGAREAALQILYQWEVGGASIDETLAAYWAVREQDRAGAETLVDRDYAAALARGTVERMADLDAAIEAQAEHWRLSRMAVIDRLILRLASYELKFMADAPPAVVINEAVELARRFSEEAAIGFVNGILDGLTRGAGKTSPSS